MGGRVHSRHCVHLDYTVVVLRHNGTMFREHWDWARSTQNQDNRFHSWLVICIIIYYVMIEPYPRKTINPFYRLLSADDWWAASHIFSNITVCNFQMPINIIREACNLLTFASPDSMEIDCRLSVGMRFVNLGIKTKTENAFWVSQLLVFINYSRINKIEYQRLVSVRFRPNVED